MHDYAQGCRLPADVWADFNRRVVFEQPQWRSLAAPFPPVELMRNVSGLENERDFAAHGAHFWEVLSKLLPKALAEYGSVLDFGCGCGRLGRMFKGHPGTVCGCDIDARHVDWVQRNLDFVRATLTAPNAPLPYADASFDLVIAISVLTHIDEPTQDRLLRELHRIARPRALLLLSTHGARALERALGEDRIFRMLDIREAELRHAAGRFSDGCHAFIRQDGHLTSKSFAYGITFIP